MGVRRVVAWSQDVHALEPSPLPDLGGFFEAGMRWKDYLESLPDGAAPYAEALRIDVVERGIKRGGNWHQHEGGSPVFDDGTYAEFSFRAWGDLLAAIWSEAENRNYCYLDFYTEHRGEIAPMSEGRRKITSTTPVALDGTCSSCGSSTLFRYSPADGRAPYIVCRSCGLSAVP